MIVIVDYGGGNLTSVARAVSHLGFECLISGQAEKIVNADRIIFPGVGAAGSAMKIMKEKGIDITDHRSKMLMKEDLKENDKVFTMTNSQKEVIEDMYGFEEVYTLKHYVKSCEDCDILDPFGFDARKYRDTRDEIEFAVNKLFDRFLEC